MKKNETTKPSLTFTPEEAEARIAALQEKSVKELRREWILLFGNMPYATRNRQFLIKRLTWRINTIINGGISERAMRRARDIADETLIRLRPKKFNVKPMEIIDTSFPEENTANSPACNLPVGTVIRRNFKGKVHEVTVIGKNMFAYEGVKYDNLTSIAWKICGYRKSGNYFFNLPTTPRHD
ncbi:MAG: DUF2924 domain-containing protein [Akkermansia sp.]|nr:DUF2924 domain-containing protein [Akkermansia sp.]MBR4107508.1 DUF2924 domain-containing protein [Akkermansia sp.]